MFEGFERKDIPTRETTIHAVVGGSGPPLLLLHGYPQTHVMWHKVAPGLAERFTVVASDLRGYGDSGKPASDPAHLAYSKRAMAEDQVEVMESLGFRALFRRRPRSRRPGRASDGARPPRPGREARRPRHRADPQGLLDRR